MFSVFFSVSASIWKYASNIVHIVFCEQFGGFMNTSPKFTVSKSVLLDCNGKKDTMMIKNGSHITEYVVRTNTTPKNTRTHKFWKVYTRPYSNTHIHHAQIYKSISPKNMFVTCNFFVLSSFHRRIYIFFSLRTPAVLGRGSGVSLSDGGSARWICILK